MVYGDTRSTTRRIQKDKQKTQVFLRFFVLAAPDVEPPGSARGNKREVRHLDRTVGRLIHSVNDLIADDAALIVIKNDSLFAVLAQNDTRADEMVRSSILGFNGLGADNGGAGLAQMVEI